MREGWGHHKIDEFCLVTDYVANGSFASLKENVQYLDQLDFAMLIRYTDHANGWNGRHKYVSESAYKFLRKSSLKPGDLIMANVGDPGNAFLLPNLGMPTTLGPNSILIRAEKEITSNEFLHYFFLSLEGRQLIDEISAGAAQRKFNKTSFRGLTIPLPPLEEQQRIVAVLDEAFEGLARARVHAEANLQNARALIEAGLGTAFNPVTAKLNGWDLSDLSSMAKLSYGYTTKANSEPNGPKFLRITDIQDGTVDWDNVPFCSTPPDDYERYRVKSGDILFARTGATTGKSYLMTDEIEAVAASYLIRLRLASMALKPEYLALFFQSDVYWETIRAGISGSTQGGFNASKLGELVVPVPPLAIQDVVISRLEEIQDQAARLTSTYFVKLQDLDDLRQSLLQKAFAGELT